MYSHTCSFKLDRANIQIISVFILHSNSEYLNSNPTATINWDVCIFVWRLVGQREVWQPTEVCNIIVWCFVVLVAKLFLCSLNSKLWKSQKTEKIYRHFLLATETVGFKSMRLCVLISEDYKNRKCLFKFNIIGTTRGRKTFMRGCLFKVQYCKVYLMLSISLFY